MVVFAVLLTYMTILGAALAALPFGGQSVSAGMQRSSRARSA